MIYRIPFIKPSFPSAEEMAKDYEKIRESNWYTNFGPFEKKFANKLGAFIGSSHNAVTFSSATSGLIAAIVGILGRGDGANYIIMPSFTFAAGADAITWCGYKPYLVDIEPNGLHMDIQKAKTIIQLESSKIAGILFCNAFGVGAKNIREWEALAKKHNIPLIIDSAAGFGSLYDENKKVGSAGDCEVFSFHATKSFAIGEGGAVITRNKKLAQNLYAIENFGFNTEKNATQLGFNGKLQEINAAIGLHQLKNFGKLLEHRRNIFARYKHKIKAEQYSFQENAENASLCFVAVIVKNANNRDTILGELHQEGIDAKIYYSPSVHKHRFFKDSKKLDALEVTERIESSVLALPSHDGMTINDVDSIAEVMNKWS